MDIKVRKFLDDEQYVSMERFEIITAIRELFYESNPLLGESIKYGGLTYSRSKKSKKLVGGIYSYKNHVSIEFSNGIDFLDSKGALEGSGKRRRHIKIREKRDIENKFVAFYIRESMKS